LPALRRPLLSRARLRPALVAAALLGGAAIVGATGATERATGTDPTRCEVFAADSATRWESPTGSGDALLVVGDSWTAGLGLERSTDSWPSRLQGRVHVAGFSGSGFSADASECGDVAFGARALEALTGLPLETPVVVAGGLNDWDRTDAEIRAGYTAVLQAVAGHPVTVVGPATAPSRATYVPRVDALLRTLSADAGVRYVSMVDLDLTYLDDQLHLTPQGHRVFGDAVRERLASQ